jgi:hypothetical protein
VPHDELAQELRQFGETATSLMDRVALREDIPPPLRAGIADRLVQIRSLLNLLARELELSTTERVPPDIVIDP